MPTNNHRGFGSILIIVLLLIALGVGIYLVNRQQLLKTKASSNPIQAFEITDPTGKPINCQPNESGIANCEITTSTVNIKLADPDILLSQ